MEDVSNAIEWSQLTPEEKKKQLYIKQKKLLDTFLEREGKDQNLQRIIRTDQNLFA